MVSKKSMAVVAAGSSVGLAQTFLLREYVDKEHGLIPGLEGLGGFGTYSAMIGIIPGVITTGLGLASVIWKGKITKSETIQLGLISYGIPALSGGLLSGLFPHPAVGLRLKAPAKAPASQVTLRPPSTLRQPAGQVAPAGQTSAIPLRT